MLRVDDLPTVHQRRGRGDDLATRDADGADARELWMLAKPHSRARDATEALDPPPADRTECPPSGSGDQTSRRLLPLGDLCVEPAPVHPGVATGETAGDRPEQERRIVAPSWSRHINFAGGAVAIAIEGARECRPARHPAGHARPRR